MYLSTPSAQPEWRRVSGHIKIRCFAFAPPRCGSTPGPVVIKPSRTRELIKDHCSGCVAILNCSTLRGTLVLYGWWDKNNSSYPQITFHCPLFLHHLQTGFVGPWKEGFDCQCKRFNYTTLTKFKVETKDEHTCKYVRFLVIALWSSSS